MSIKSRDDWLWADDDHHRTSHITYWHGCVAFTMLREMSLVCQIVHASCFPVNVIQHMEDEWPACSCSESRHIAQKRGESHCDYMTHMQTNLHIWRCQEWSLGWLVGRTNSQRQDEWQKMGTSWQHAIEWLVEHTTQSQILQALRKNTRFERMIELAS